MADRQDYGGLEKQFDLSKINVYGLEEERLKELQDAQRQAIENLQKRYAEPNWFKVAAGFAKPQLGGFVASLGSAAEALGENVEQQRAQELPISQLRLQMYQTNLIMGQNKKAADMVAERKRQGLPLTPEFAAEVARIAPDSPVAKALATEIGTQQKQQELFLQSVAQKRAAGMELSPEDKSRLAGLQSDFQPPTAGRVAPQQAPAEVPAVKKPAVEFKLESFTPAQQLEILKKNIKEETDPNVIIGMAEQIKNLQGQQEPSKPKEPAKYYPMTFQMPDIAGKSTAETQALMQAFAEQANKQEGAYIDKFNKIAAQASGPDYTNTRNTYDSVIGMMQNNPQLSAKVFNLIRNNGQLAAALNAGLGVSMGGWGASINLPVKPFLEAGFTREQQKFADTMLTYLTQLGAAKLKASGQTTANTTQTEYMSMLRAAAGLDQTPEAAFLTLRKDKANFDYNKELYDTLVQERKENVNPQSVTKLSDVFQNSSRIKELDEKFRRINERLDSEYQQSLRGRR